MRDGDDVFGLWRDRNLDGLQYERRRRREWPSRRAKAKPRAHTRRQRRTRGVRNESDATGGRDQVLPHPRRPSIDLLTETGVPFHVAARVPFSVAISTERLQSTMMVNRVTPLHESSSQHEVTAATHRAPDRRTKRGRARVGFDFDPPHRPGSGGEVDLDDFATSTRTEQRRAPELTVLTDKVNFLCAKSVRKVLHLDRSVRRWPWPDKSPKP